MAETYDNDRRVERRRRVSTTWLLVLVLVILVVLAILVFPFVYESEAGPDGPVSSTILQTIGSRATAG